MIKRKAPLNPINNFIANYFYFFTSKHKISSRTIRIFKLIAILGFLDAPAYAYIDPGTGSTLVYIVTAIVISSYYILREFYHKLIELFFLKRFKSNRCDLLIHSEDPRYEITFLPVLKNLHKLGVDCTYVTMYERTNNFESLPPNTTHKCIPPGLPGYSYLNHAEAKLLVTTTPQIDVMTFKRSKKIKHYSIISHALGESRYVRPFAYDYFDSVLCCGKLLKQNIRTIEDLRGLPAKQLLETGIPHYDELIERLAPPGAPNSKPVILIAPSWGPMSSFEVLGIDFVRKVAEKYQVIVRPHPQMKISQNDIYQEVLKMDGVEIDTNSTPDGSMKRADLLISDISGITYEFAFILEKPVIVIDHPEKNIGALEGHFLRDVKSLRDLCEDFIIRVKPSEMGNLNTIIESTINKDLTNKIRGPRKEFIYNWGNAGATAAHQIKEILQCI